MQALLKLMMPGGTKNVSKYALRLSMSKKRRTTRTRETRFRANARSYSRKVKKRFRARTGPTGNGTRSAAQPHKSALLMTSLLSTSDDDELLHYLQIRRCCSTVFVLFKISPKVLCLNFSEPFFPLNFDQILNLKSHNRII